MKTAILWRGFLALIVSYLITSVIFVILFPLYHVVAGAALILLGAPMHIWLLCTHRNQYKYYVRAGIGLGILAAYLFLLSYSLDHTRILKEDFLDLLVRFLAPLPLSLFGGFFGFIITAIAWMIARPDKYNFSR